MTPCSLLHPPSCVLSFLPSSSPSPATAHSLASFTPLISALSYLVIITPLHGNTLKWLLSWYSEFYIMALAALHCSVARGLSLPSVPGYYSFTLQLNKIYRNAYIIHFINTTHTRTHTLCGSTLYTDLNHFSMLCSMVHIQVSVFPFYSMGYKQKSFLKCELVKIVLFSDLIQLSLPLFSWKVMPAHYRSSFRKHPLWNEYLMRYALPIAGT